MSYEIIHNEAENRFEVEIDGLLSVIEYFIANGVINVTSTRVPQELSGKGIAAALTQALLDYAKEKALEVNPICSYVAKYIERQNSK